MLCLGLFIVVYSFIYSLSKFEVRIRLLFIMYYILNSCYTIDHWLTKFYFRFWSFQHFRDFIYNGGQLNVESSSRSFILLQCASLKSVLCDQHDQIGNGITMSIKIKEYEKMERRCRGKECKWSLFPKCYFRLGVY